MKNAHLILLALLLISLNSYSQTIGLFTNTQESFDGYTLFSPQNSKETYLINNCGEKGLFIIGATNRPDRIDSAILRTGRIDKKIYCPPPDHESRFGMFEAFLKNRPTMEGLDYDLLASRTECYVSSDIQFIVNEASKAALKERIKIEMSHLNQALQSVKSSLTVSQEEKIRSAQEDWKKRYGTNSSN